MSVEARFPVAPDSARHKPFLPELYFRRCNGGVEIGVANRRGEDYAWSILSFQELDAALALLKIEDSFDDAGRQAQEPVSLPRA